MVITTFQSLIRQQQQAQSEAARHVLAASSLATAPAFFPYAASRSIFSCFTVSFTALTCSRIAVFSSSVRKVEYSCGLLDNLRLVVHWHSFQTEIRLGIHHEAPCIFPCNAEILHYLPFNRRHCVAQSVEALDCGRYRLLWGSEGRFGGHSTAFLITSARLYLVAVEEDLLFCDLDCTLIRVELGIFRKLARGATSTMISGWILVIHLLSPLRCHSLSLEKPLH